MGRATPARWFSRPNGAISTPPSNRSSARSSAVWRTRCGGSHERAHVSRPVCSGAGAHRRTAVERNHNRSPGWVARPRRGGFRDRTGQSRRLHRIAARRDRARSGGHVAEAVMNERISLAPYVAELERIDAVRWTGELTQVVGLLVESRGPAVAIGDFCEIHAANG